MDPDRPNPVLAASIAVARVAFPQTFANKITETDEWAREGGWFAASLLKGSPNLFENLDHAPRVMPVDWKGTFESFRSDFEDARPKNDNRRPLERFGRKTYFLAPSGDGRSPRRLYEPVRANARAFWGGEKAPIHAPRGALSQSGLLHEVVPRIHRPSIWLRERKPAWRYSSLRGCKYLAFEWGDCQRHFAEIRAHRLYCELAESPTLQKQSALFPFLRLAEFQGEHTSQHYDGWASNVVNV